MFSGKTSLVSCDAVEAVDTPVLRPLASFPLPSELRPGCRVTANNDLYVMDPELGAVLRLDPRGGDAVRLDLGEGAIPVAIAALPARDLLVLVRTANSYCCRRLNRDGNVLGEQAIDAELLDPVDLAASGDDCVLVVDRRGHAIISAGPDGISKRSGRASYAESLALAAHLDDRRRDQFLAGGLLEYPTWVASNEHATLVVDRGEILYGLGPWLGVVQQPRPFFFGHPVMRELAAFLLGEDSTLLMISLASFEWRLFRLPVEARDLSVLPAGELVVLTEQEVLHLEPPAWAEPLWKLPATPIVALAHGRMGMRYAAGVGHVTAVSPGGGIVWDTHLDLACDGSASLPTGLAYWEDPDREENDRLFVCVHGQPALRVFAADGRSLPDIPLGVNGAEDVVLVHGEGLGRNLGVANRAFFLAIADRLWNRVLLLDSDGEVVSELGREPDRRPEDIVLRPTRLRSRGMLLDAHSATGRTIRFDLSIPRRRRILDPRTFLSIEEVRDQIISGMLVDSAVAWPEPDIVLTLALTIIKFGYGGIDLLEELLRAGADPNLVRRVSSHLGAKLSADHRMDLSLLEMRYRCDGRVINAGFLAPSRLALAPDRSLWVSDYQSGELVHLAADGVEISPRTPIGRPLGIWIDGDEVFVCDSANRRVCWVRPEGRVETVFTRPDIIPVGIKRRCREDAICALDIAGARVFELSREWSVMSTIVIPREDGKRLPSDFAFDREGNFVVVEWPEHPRIQVLMPDGAPRGSIPPPPYLPPARFSPRCICADEEGSIFVADGEARCVWWYKSGEASPRVIGLGFLNAPFGLAASRGRLYVADSGVEGRIVRFDLPADQGQTGGQP